MTVSLTDIERYATMDEEYVEPKTEEFKPRVCFLLLSPSYELIVRVTQPHLRAWLGDEQGRDQYVTYRDTETIVRWHGKPSQRR